MSAAIGLTTLAILILLFMSAFFSGSETALTAVSRARMLALEKSGDHAAGIVGRLIADRERLIGALLLGNNLVNILAASLATSLFLSLFGQAGVAYATLVMTVVVLVFAEVLPKTVAIGDPDRFSRAVGRIVRPIVWLFSPFVIAVEVVISGILNRLGSEGSHGRGVFSAAEEIRGQVDLLHQEGAVVKDERDRLSGVLDLGELQLVDTMIHRTRMDTLNIAEPPAAIILAALSSAHSRQPVWEGDPDNIIGTLHVRDLLRALNEAEGDTDAIDIRALLAQPWFVPETTLAKTQLNAFLRKKVHLALVVDEYGEVQGLITLEDILEEIVGAIDDEYDVSHHGIRRQPDGSVHVDGAVPIRDLNRAMDWDLPDDEATTVAGLVLEEAERIPEEGQEFIVAGYRARVLRSTPTRIVALAIARPDAPPSATG